MKLSAFAKINWSLDITGVREDGYHLMDMVMQPVSISDEITLAPSRKKKHATHSSKLLLLRVLLPLRQKQAKK